MRRLPLFVLPTVLFPGGHIPLHVFEPRYRQMVGYCLEHDKRFGLLFHRNDVHGPFQVEAGRIGCVAEIGEFRPLPDGRSLMLAHGIKRFRISDGVESAARYHEALVEDYSDEEQNELSLIIRRQESIELFKSLLRKLPETPEGPLSLDARREVSFELAGAIEIDPVWHQGLLELQTEWERLEQIDEVLRAVLEAHLAEE
jgi:Lon protease-like protein